MPRLAQAAATLILALAALSTTGCGALVARAKIVGGQTAVSAAKRANADAKSTYEYTLAQLYLEKAREEESYGRFGAAIEFGGKAEQLGEQAKRNAATAENDSAAPPQGQGR